MYQIQTIIIYLFLFFILFSLSKSAVKNRNWNYIMGGLIIYTIIFGIRYEVGMDYANYLYAYENKGTDKYGLGIDLFEPGFTFIISLFNFIGAHFTLFFGFIAFMQIYYVFKTFKYNYDLYPYLVFTFMIGCVWLDFSNGLRQILALCLFIYSISLLDKKHWFLSCLVYTLIGVSMHKSAAVLIVLCILLRNKVEWTSNLKIQFLTFIIAFIIGNIGFVQQVFGQLDVILSYMQYEHYLERNELEDMINREVSKGIGFYGILCTDIILIASSNKVKQYFNYNPYFKRIYNLYFIGVLIRYAFLTSMMIQRVNFYFYFFKFIVATHTLLWSKKYNKSIFTALILLYLLYFIGTLSSMENNASLYKFFWQIN